MPFRAAILARFSTDKQRQTSCDDQLRIGRNRAERDGWLVVDTYRDDAVSGMDPIDTRPDGARMLIDAMAGRFDILILEGLDRLSRDMVEQERIVRRLEHRGIRIIGYADGYDSSSPVSLRKIHRGMRGIINEVYLDDLREKVHRGLDGQFERGLFAGGLSYGYKSVPVSDDPEDGYRLQIDDSQAPWVRFIHEKFAQGWSCQRIAAELNSMRIKSPRGSTWAVSALYGSPRKGTGILNNPLYVGEYIWNRSTWVKDPDTKKRTRIERPESEWRRRQVPELRIVPDEHWQKTRSRLSTRRQRGAPKRTLFSGLLRCGICGICGGAVVAVSKYDYGCAARKDRGISVCPGVRAPRVKLEATVLARVQKFLTSAKVEKHIKRLARESLKRHQEARREAKNDTSSRIDLLEREITNMTDAIARHGLSDALSRRLADTERELAKVKAQPVQKAPLPVPDMVPRLLERYRAAVATLKPGRERNIDEARNGLKEIVDVVELIPEAGNIYADIGGLFGNVMP